MSMHKIESKSSLSKQDTPNTTSTKKRLPGSNNKNKIYSHNFYRDTNNKTDISPSGSSKYTPTQTFLEGRPKPKNRNSQMQMHLEMKNTRVRNSQKLSSNKASIQKHQIRSNKFKECKFDDDEIEMLKKENDQLKKQIVQFKVTQFYQFDDDKLKQLITQVQDLKSQIKKYCQQIQSLKLENDFLNRANYQLKLELKNITIKQMQNSNNPYNSCKSEQAYDLKNLSIQKNMQKQKMKDLGLKNKKADNGYRQSTAEYLTKNQRSNNRSSLFLEEIQETQLFQKPKFQTSTKNTRKKYMNKISSSDALFFCSQGQSLNEKNLSYKNQHIETLIRNSQGQIQPVKKDSEFKQKNNRKNKKIVNDKSSLNHLQANKYQIQKQKQCPQIHAVFSRQNQAQKTSEKKAKNSNKNLEHSINNPYLRKQA